MESINLLSFVNSASSNIQEALGKAPKKRRNVTVKKYAEKRLVKRLDNKKAKPGSANLTKRKSSQLKPTSARLPPPSSSSSPLHLLQHSNTWPAITTTALSSTTISSIQTNFYSSSETNVCQPSSSSRQPISIDPELESLLYELESSVPMSRCGSFESVCTGPSCTPPLSTLEAQVYISEQQAFSPYSDYSDEMDSAYCSPGNSAQVSYSCSPTNMGSMPDWCPTDLLPPPLNTTCMQEAGQAMISPRCNWVSQDTLPPLTINTADATSNTSVYDQGPPMTPTVSQLLEQYHPY